MNPFKKKTRPPMVLVNVVTWNVHHGTTAKELAVDLARVLREGRWEGRDVEVLLLQEFKPQKGHSKVIRKAGFDLEYFAPEFAVAWDRERFEYHGEHEWEGEHDYWAEPRALTVTLVEKSTGKKRRFTTYHPPAHVQRRDHGKWNNIWKALAETDRMWDRKAKRSAENGVPYIAGGDDNVHEGKGYFPQFLRRMIRGAARQVQPPEPTHGRRMIDDFRINRLVKVVRGSKRVINGLHSDHDAFRCVFRLLG